MTELRVQKLYVPNCEDAFEQKYFGWGQVQNKNTPKLEWSQATPEQRHLIAARGYALYDGLPCLQPPSPLNWPATSA